MCLVYEKTDQPQYTTTVQTYYTISIHRFSKGRDTPRRWGPGECYEIFSGGLEVYRGHYVMINIVKIYLSHPSEMRSGFIWSGLPQFSPGGLYTSLPLPSDNMFCFV